MGVERVLKERKHLLTTDFLQNKGYLIYFERFHKEIFKNLTKKTSFQILVIVKVGNLRLNVRSFLPLLIPAPIYRQKDLVKKGLYLG